MRALLERISSGVGRAWCRTMHPAPIWPIHNHYICRRCQRQWPVPWVEQLRDERSGHESAAVTQLRPAQRSL